MVDCHNLTHFCVMSLKMLKLSLEQGVLSSGHCSRSSIVCVSVPDLSRLSVFHGGQGALLPGGRLSDG